MNVGLVLVLLALVGPRAATEVRCFFQEPEGWIIEYPTEPLELDEFRAHVRSQTRCVKVEVGVSTDIAADSQPPGTVINGTRVWINAAMDRTFVVQIAP